MHVPEQQEAANSLEDLVIGAKVAIQYLRAGQSNTLAYALAYDLRWRMSKVVQSLGVGAPLARSRDMAKEIIDAQIWAEGASNSSPAET